MKTNEVLEAELNIMSLFSDAQFAQIIAVRTAIEALFTAIAFSDPDLADVVSTNVQFLAEEKRDTILTEEAKNSFDMVVAELQNGLHLFKDAETGGKIPYRESRKSAGNQGADHG